MKNQRAVLLVAALILAGSAYAYAALRPRPLVLTGIVTTNDVIVSPQVAGQIAELRVREGDAVQKGQLLATIVPDELRADTAYYAQNVAGMSSQVRESEAALRLEQRQLDQKVAQAESMVAAAESQAAAAAAEVAAARSTYARTQDLARQQVASAQDLDQTRAAAEAADAKSAAAAKQVQAQRASLDLARADAEQVSVRRSQLQAQQHLQAAADAQRAKADVRLGYAEIKAPLAAVVDVRAARAGEYVTPGQPVLTLVDPDDLWVRADLEESYVDRVKIGDTLAVRLPSGAERPGTVFFRGVDAGYATQRDVSRTKRDIKTFEIRLRVDNRDRALAPGLTAYVAVPLR